VRLVERAWVNSINQRSKESFLDFHAESTVLYDPTLESLKGRLALDKMWTDLFSMFPDYHIRRVRSFGQDDWICLEVEESGLITPIVTQERPKLVRWTLIGKGEDTLPILEGYSSFMKKWHPNATLKNHRADSVKRPSLLELVEQRKQGIGG